MSIQSFTEEVFKSLDRVFENEANVLLNEARTDGGKTQYVAGRMDGISAAASKIREVYSLFVKQDKEDQDDTKALY